MGASLGGTGISMARGRSSFEVTGIRRAERGRHECRGGGGVSMHSDLGRELNQLEEGIGEEDGVVRSVVDEEAEEPRNDSQDDVLCMDGDEEVEEPGDNGGGGGTAAVHAKHGPANSRIGWARCFPLRFRRSSSEYSI